MQLTALLLTTLSALTLAAPSTTDKRACTPRFPAGVSNIALSKTVGAPSTTQNLSWDVPAGAGGPCTLIATFPAGYPIASSGNAQVNVIDVNGPAPGSIVGTVTFASDPSAPKTTYINSFACRANMQYKLVLATEGAGSVSFAEGNGAGIALTYGC
ncbi:hypothetical protein OQA88_6906 [Cercophora sp. LCS_1]